MGQSSILMVLTVAFVLALTIRNSNKSINESSNSGIDYYFKNVSANICKSATDMLLSLASNDKNFRVSDLINKDMLGGSVNYILNDTLINSSPKIKITVVANYRGSKSKNILVASPILEGVIPPGINAALTSNSNVSATGYLIVDGRDHDLSGNVLSNNGNFGVWSTGSLNRDNFAQVGGYNNENYPPSINPDSNIIKQNQYLPSGFPDSPDKIMGGDTEGFSEGTLLSLAQSGSNGSQYVNDPAELNYPLEGVTYIELAPGTQWDYANIEGTGILIVHNSSENSLISNLTGTFKGIVIADDVN